MTSPIARKAPEKPVVHRPQMRLPHPSWRLSGARHGNESPVSADDFWKRLGL